MDFFTLTVEKAGELVICLSIMFLIPYLGSRFGTLVLNIYLFSKNSVLWMPFLRIFPNILLLLV
jgi:hypothetical protein